MTITTPMPDSRLPLAITGMILVAEIALYTVTQSSGIALLFGVLLLASYTTHWRIDSESGVWGIRLGLLILGITLSILKPLPNSESIIDIRWTNTLGVLCAAELLCQAWRRQPNRGVLLTLPGIIFLAASNSFDMRAIHWWAPAFTLCLILSLPSYRVSGASTLPRNRLIGLLFCACTLALGMIATALIHRNKLEIYFLGDRLLSPREISTTGLSNAPSLGATFGLRGSTRRVLRIQGSAQLRYLRAMAFSEYNNGRWAPDGTSRLMMPLTRYQIQKQLPGERLHIVELVPTQSTLYLPKETAAIWTDSELEWSPQFGGPIRHLNQGLATYDPIIPDTPSAKTILSDLGTDEREALLAVPVNLNSRIRTLADNIAPQTARPQEKIKAVTQYLTTRYHYSLTTDPGNGDPVTNFLLQHKSAHCEYFASGATILLRLLGVPTRYVIGYYAHEVCADGMVVRQRDAHAWAESWVNGVGWVTVDATPGDGRPDQTTDLRPWIGQRLFEWVQDQIGALQAWVLGLSLWQILGIVALLVVPFFLQRMLRARRRRISAAVSRGYTVRDKELAILAQRFTAWLVHAGFPCPETRPWQEHLAQINASDVAQAFVCLYTPLRFGPTCTSEDIQALHQLLCELERAGAKQ